MRHITGWKPVPHNAAAPHNDDGDGQDILAQTADILARVADFRADGGGFNVAAWITATAVMVLAQVEGGDPAGGAGVSSVEVQSIWDFVLKGGPMMIPIILCSFVAFAVAVERALTLRRSRVMPDGFIDGATAALGSHTNGKSATERAEGRRKAMEYCRNNDSPIARIFLAGVKHLGEPVERIEKHIDEAGQREVFRMRKYLRVLAVVASIAPLLGLLGTIFGMIEAFQTVATSGEALGKTELLAEGIYEAMITTAGGLIVAIPVLVAHSWLSARIEQLVLEIDQSTVDFLEQYVTTGVVAHAPESSKTTSPPAGRSIAQSDGDGQAADAVRVSAAGVAV